MKRLYNFNNTFAFSLLEAIITLVLVALIGGYLAHTMSDDLENAALQTATQGVFAHLQLAQSLATTTGDDHGFRANSSSTYEVYEVSSGNPVTDPQTNTSLNIDISSKYPGTSFQSAGFPAFNIVFISDGTINNGSNITVTLENTNSESTQIIVYTSGRIEIQ